MPAGTLEVFLIGAVGIKNTEVFGKADPYAVILCGRQRFRSNTASNQGSKPVWNQKFSIYIDDTVSELQIKIYNHNILTEDDEIGGTVIPLAKIFAEGSPKTTSYNVVRPSGRVQGEVKLSIAFNPKIKPGQDSSSNTPLSASGPYNTEQHGSPYTTGQSKHDPLTGPFGYFRNNSSAPSDSDQGSSRVHPSSTPDAYPPSVYPPVPAVNEPQVPYLHQDSSASYTSLDDFSPSRRQEGTHGSQSTSDYGGSAYQHSPYAQFPRPQGPYTPVSAHHGTSPISSTSSPYTQHGDHNNYSSVPSTKPYGGYDDLAVNFGALNVSGNSSEGCSHESHHGYHKPQTSSAQFSTGYPSTDSSHHGNYPGYNPPPNATGNVSSGYPPPAYPPLSYSSQFHNSSGQFSHATPFPTQYGYQAPPPPSYYPPQVHGHCSNPPPPDQYPPPPPMSYVPQPDAYPPVHLGHPNAPYIPAGYPK